MRYRYRVIPFIGQSKGSVSPSDVASQLESVISEHAVDGWEFYQLSDVNIEVQPGCLAGLFGGKTQYLRFDQVIFRSEQRASASSQRATPPSPSRSAPSGLDPNSDKPTNDSGNRESLNDREQLTFCYHCGADLPPERSVCTACGKKL